MSAPSMISGEVQAVPGAGRPRASRPAELRLLMLVSQRADAALREAVRRRERPSPEYLRLEAKGVELLDWSRLGDGKMSRSLTLSVRHAYAAWARLRHFDVVISDGEHVGIPMALAMRWGVRRRPHLVIGHHLTTRAKTPFFRWLSADSGMSRIVVHSSRQLALAQTRLGISKDRLVLAPYCVDADFWQPKGGADEALIVSAGREHRDYSTLAAACENLPVRVRVAFGSPHSPAAHSHQPDRWPANFEVRAASYAELRDLYAAARVVVVPLVDNDFQAGITTALEAMAMGKPVILTATRGQEIIRDGQNGLLVPPADPGALRLALASLLGAADRRAELGAAARRIVEQEYGLDRFCATLLTQMQEIGEARGRG